MGIDRDALDLDRSLDILGLDRPILVGVQNEANAMLGTELSLTGLRGTESIKEVATHLDQEVRNKLAATAAARAVQLVSSTPDARSS